MGRPTIYTDLRARKLVGALRAGRPFQAACQAAGIGETTGRGWVSRGRRESSGVYHELAKGVDEAIAAAERDKSSRSRPWRGIWVQLTWNPDEAITYPPGLEGDALEDFIQGHIDSGRLVLGDDGIVRPCKLHADYFSWIARGRPDDDDHSGWFRERERDPEEGRWTAE